MCKQFQSISKYIYTVYTHILRMFTSCYVHRHSFLHPNHDWRLVFQMLHHWPLRGSGRHHHFDPSCKTLYEPFNSCGASSGWLHGRMACVSYQFRFCWVDASLMFTDWTPFGSWLCRNNGALSILNFSVISTWVDRHVSQVQTGQTKSIGSCLFCTILPPAWCISLLILSMVPSPLSFFPDPSASCRLRLSSCRATAATQME